MDGVSKRKCFRDFGEKWNENTRFSPMGLTNTPKKKDTCQCQCEEGRERVTSKETKGKIALLYK